MQGTGRGLLGLGRRSRMDLDGDGLVGRRDACPEAAERVNGWADDDGCPDELAELRVVATRAGEAVTAAGLEASDGNEIFAARPGPLLVEGRLPDSAWSLRAVVDCLEGEALAVLSEGANAVEVPLQPVRDAVLRFVVVDSSGAPVPDATVRWRSAGRGCGPVEVQRADLAAFVGGGTHEIVVSAPGRALRRVRVTLDRGEERSIRVVLPPPPS